MRTLLYEAANVMLTRYKGQLKLKDWAFAIAQAINDAKGESRSGSPPRNHHARDAARRDGVRISLSPRILRDRRPNPVPRGATPEGGAADGADCVAAALLSRRRFQPSHTAPSLPHQVPNEHAENAGTRKRRNPEP